MMKIFLSAVIVAWIAACGPAKEVPYGDNPDAGHTTRINGVDIYYEMYGEGEPLLLIHGNRGSSARFAGQIPEFARHYKVIAPDSRAQGKSTADTAELTYRLLASDMAALIDTLGLGRVNIIGHSDGAIVGLELAACCPEKVDTLIMYAGNYRIDESSVFSPDFYRRYAKQSEAQTDPLKRRLYRMVLLHPDFTPEDLRRIRVPVLVMAGEKDVVLEAHTREMEENLPQADLCIVPGAGHSMPQEQPAEFNKIVLDYLLKRK